VVPYSLNIIFPEWKACIPWNAQERSLEQKQKILEPFYIGFVITK
jgi:hypothetical protein